MIWLSRWFAKATGLRFESYRCHICGSLHHHELDCPRAVYPEGFMTRRQA